MGMNSRHNGGKPAAAIANIYHRNPNTVRAKPRKKFTRQSPSLLPRVRISGDRILQLHATRGWRVIGRVDAH